MSAMKNPCRWECNAYCDHPRWSRCTADRFAGFSRLLRNHQSCWPIGSSGVAPRGSDRVPCRPLPFLLVPALCLRVQKHRRKLAEIRPLAVLSFQKRQPGTAFTLPPFLPIVLLAVLLFPLPLPAPFYPAGSSSATDQAVDRITERPVNHSEGTLWLVSASDRSTTKL